MFFLINNKYKKLQFEKCDFTLDGSRKNFYMDIKIYMNV